MITTSGGECYRGCQRPVYDTLTSQAGFYTGTLYWVKGMLVARVRYESGNSGYVRTDMLRYI